MIRLAKTLLYALLAGWGLSAMFTSHYLGHAQMQDPQDASNEMAPSTRSPIGTKQGMDELKALLDTSDPTNNPTVRMVVICIPKKLPDYIRLHETPNTAIREFFLIADSNSLRLSDNSARTVPDLESPQGVRARLPNGGSITLRIRRVNENRDQRAIGEINIRGHQIPDYEQVNRLEFVPRPSLSQEECASG